MWHVVQDPSSNQFFRLNDSAYKFIALLDSKRTVSEAWDICNDQMGDDAPTQGEVIQLLGQLYTSNLIRADLPPDTEGMFRRYRKRTGREVRGYLMSLLFIRIPLFDPDSFLNRWVKLFGAVFTKPALLFWLILVSFGLYSILGRFDELFSGGSRVLDPSNLPFLYLSFAGIKLFHEFGHAFACKKFGLAGGTGGEVHTMGIMFLVFMPLPYVDASSAWAFRSKWHRVIVGLAGMWTEIAVAAVAAIVWANTGDGHPVHTIAYNVMFIASVSTLLFNGNPLLRYDAYYILSDLLETPNLAQRSKQYIYYVIRKFIYGVRRPQCPAHSPGEKVWFFFYGLASTVFRVFISVRILMFVSQKMFFIGAILAIMAAVTWLMVPLGKFLHYLVTNGELARTRTRACLATLLFVVLVLSGIGLIDRPDHLTASGGVWFEPDAIIKIHSAGAGEIVSVLPCDGLIIQAGSDGKAGPALLKMISHRLLREREMLQLDLEILDQKRKLALSTKDQQALVEAIDLQIVAARSDLEKAEKEIAALAVKATMTGQWVHSLDNSIGTYVSEGQEAGIFVDMSRPVILTVAGPDIAPLLIEEIYEKGNEGARKVELRVNGRSDETFTGRILSIESEGKSELPFRSLGYALGGSVATSQDDNTGRKAAERFYEVLIIPDCESSVRLLAGQRVSVRFVLPDKPLARQWWRSIRQLVARKFRI